MNVHDEETQAPNKMCSISLFIRPRKERRQTEGRGAACVDFRDQPHKPAVALSIGSGQEAEGEKSQGAWPNKGVRVVTYFK